MIDTPTRRDQIERLTANRHPGCRTVFADNQDGTLSFRIQAASGRFRTGTIRLLNHHKPIRLNKAWLDKQIHEHGGPAAP